jgi:hypothetical protein
MKSMLMIRNESTTSAKHTIARALTYLRNQRERMNYPDYRRRGLPITSSQIESTIKQVNKRVKGSEKFWDRCYRSDPTPDGRLYWIPNSNRKILGRETLENCLRSEFATSEPSKRSQKPPDLQTTICTPDYFNTTQDSLPVAGQALLNGLSTRRAPMKGLKAMDYISFPFPRLSWRNRCDRSRFAT